MWDERLPYRALPLPFDALVCSVVKVKKPGTYIIKYTCRDKHLERTVIVKEGVAPGAGIVASQYAPLVLGGIAVVAFIIIRTSVKGKTN